MFFLFADLCVCFNTKLYKNIPNVDFMAILMKLATCHIRNAFKRPLRQNASTVRVLTSVILKVIGWAFRKLYPTKITGMVHQGLLAPQRLEAFVFLLYKNKLFEILITALHNNGIVQRIVSIVHYSDSNIKEFVPMICHFYL